MFMTMCDESVAVIVTTEPVRSIGATSMQFGLIAPAYVQVPAKFSAPVFSLQPTPIASPATRAINRSADVMRRMVPASRGSG